MTRLGIRLLAVITPLALAACARTLPPAPVELRGNEVHGRPGASALASAGESAVVRPGESVYAFARRNHIPARAVIEANSLSPPYQVEPGRRLVLPEVRTHEVQGGESLGALARQYGVSRESFAHANGIEPPYVIRTGQLLIVPGPVGKRSDPPTTAIAAAPSGAATPAGATPPVAAATGPAPAPVVVASAGSARAISGIDQSTLPPPPGASTSSGPIGSAPTPPASETAKSRGSRPAVAAPAAPAVVDPPPVAAPAPPAASPQAIAPPAAAPPAPIAAAPPIASAPTAAPPPSSAAAEPPAAIGDQARLDAAEPREAVTTPPPPRAGRNFYWPLKGTILSDFGSKPGGLHNDGINISAQRGTPIRASENGVVVYAGNELRGFGNLLLVRHAGGWMTAYGHADELLVGRGDQVKRGQIIARVGSTGNVNAPQLHFEIRRGSRAVNPTDFLDQSRQMRVAGGA